MNAWVVMSIGCMQVKAHIMLFVASVLVSSSNCGYDNWYTGNEVVMLARVQCTVATVTVLLVTVAPTLQYTVQYGTQQHCTSEI